MRRLSFIIYATPDFGLKFLPCQDLDLPKQIAVAPTAPLTSRDGKAKQSGWRGEPRGPGRRFFSAVHSGANGGLFASAAWDFTIP